MDKDAMTFEEAMGALSDEPEIVSEGEEEATPDPVEDEATEDVEATGEPDEEEAPSEEDGLLLEVPDEDDLPGLNLIRRDGKIFAQWETQAGETFEMSLAELRAGNMRNKDYSRNKEDLVAKQRQFEAEQSQARERVERAEAVLTEFAINDPYAGIDWVTLAQRDPQRFSLLQAQKMEHDAKRGAAQEKLEEMRQQQQMERTRATEAALLEQFPNWRDPQVAQKAATELRDAAQIYGLSPEKLGEYLLVEPSLARMLLDARQFHTLSKDPASVTKRVVEVGKTLSPGPKTTAKQARTRQQQEARKRFHKTGSIEDAMRLDF